MKMGRHSQRDPLKDEQYTPKWMFDHMGIEFDLDVAAPTGGAPHVPARRYYTEAEDGLVQPWSGLVFMNPPYSSAKPWVEKFIAHGNGIALLPFSKSQWFRDLWQKASAISAVLNDVEFETPTDKKNKIFMQVALFAMGEQAKEILINAKISKVR